MVDSLPMTCAAEDLLRMPNGNWLELINGKPIERQQSALANYVSGQVASELAKFVDLAKKGWIFGFGASFRVGSDDVRKANVAFIAIDRFTIHQVRTEELISVIPDLAVIVISANDRAHDVYVRTEEWFGAGVKVAWVIDPEVKKIHTHLTDGSLTKLGVTNDLTAEEILPGFRCPVASLFP